MDEFGLEHRGYYPPVTAGMFSQYRPKKPLSIGPCLVAEVAESRPLGNKLLYLDLPSNLSAPADKPRATVLHCKPCA